MWMTRNEGADRFVSIPYGRFDMSYERETAVLNLLERVLPAGAGTLAVAWVCSGGRLPRAFKHPRCGCVGPPGSAELSLLSNRRKVPIRGASQSQR